jgi:hypothetical protein
MDVGRLSARMHVHHSPSTLAAAVVLAFLQACAAPVPDRISERPADGWTATCSNTSGADCLGVAKLFLGNLAFSADSVRLASNGQLLIEPSQCPAPLPSWAVPNACWRSWAPMSTSRACMIIARQSDATSSPFGQVGGDIYTGNVFAPPPGSAPC